MVRLCCLKTCRSVKCMLAERSALSRRKSLRWSHLTAQVCSFISEIIIVIAVGFGFTFLVQAHPGSPRQNPDSHKTVVVVEVVVVIEQLHDVVVTSYSIMAAIPLPSLQWRNHKALANQPLTSSCVDHLSNSFCHQQLGLQLQVYIRRYVTN